LDCYGCDRQRISDINFIYRFLDDLPTRIGMTKITQPYVFEYRGKVPEDWGLSGIVLIAESHISMHTFVEKGYVGVDIFSCKDFDTVPVEKMIAELLGAKSYDRDLLFRGRHFPRNEKVLEGIVQRQRSKSAKTKVPPSA